MRVNKKISDWQPTIGVDDVKEDKEDEDDKEITFVDTIKQYCIPAEFHRKYILPEPEAEGMLYSEFLDHVNKFFKKSELVQKGKIVITDSLKEDFDFDIEEEEEIEDEED